MSTRGISCPWLRMCTDAPSSGNSWTKFNKHRPFDVVWKLQAYCKLSRNQRTGLWFHLLAMVETCTCLYSITILRKAEGFESVNAYFLSRKRISRLMLLRRLCLSNAWLCTETCTICYLGLRQSTNSLLNLLPICFVRNNMSQAYAWPNKLNIPFAHTCLNGIKINISAFPATDIIAPTAFILLHLSSKLLMICSISDMNLNDLGWISCSMRLPQFPEEIMGGAEAGLVNG